MLGNYRVEESPAAPHPIPGVKTIPVLTPGLTYICLKLPPWGPDDLLMYVEDEALTPPLGTEINVAFPPAANVMVVKQLRLEPTDDGFLLDRYVVVAPKT